MFKDGKIKIIKEDGTIKEYSIIFTYDNPNNNKSYVVYTDNSKNEKNEIINYTSCYDPLDNHSPLTPVEDDSELEEINKILKAILKNSR